MFEILAALLPSSNAAVWNNSSAATEFSLSNNSSVQGALPVGESRHRLRKYEYAFSAIMRKGKI
jgi:hypothetical protein